MSFITNTNTTNTTSTKEDDNWKTKKDSEPKSFDDNQKAEDEWIRLLTLLNIPKTHVTVGVSNFLGGNVKHVKHLLIHRKLPHYGWSDVEIQHLLLTLGTLDTNSKSACGIASNPPQSQPQSQPQRWCGVGEREGRVFSSLVRQRHYGLAHGMGRSGDITEPQPKAVGSTILCRLTLPLVLDAVQRGAGLAATSAAKHGILLPLCTGMSMSLVLSSLRPKNQSGGNMPKSLVLWSRIDQKSCFKAVTCAGLTCVVVPTRLEGDQVVTDLEALEALLDQYQDQVLAVITTTSCFAPRAPDRVDQVAKLLATQTRYSQIYHLINHAYGLQCTKTCKLLNRACTIGRVDAIVCSMDKNFLVPVGGALVLSPSSDVIANIGSAYAGRASSAPLVDLFITLLSMGLTGYQDLLRQRQNELLTRFTTQLQQVAIQHGERLLQCPDNTISFGITLDSLVMVADADADADADGPSNLEHSEQDDTIVADIGTELSGLGSMLFARCVSGTRVIPRGVTKKLGGIEFVGFGSSNDHYPHAYLTAACAIGLSQVEVEEFMKRLDKTLTEFRKRQRKKQNKATTMRSVEQPSA